VLSLRDFVMLMDRFDTAGDFVPYLEFCYDLRASLDRRVHAEEVTTQRVADRIGDLMKRYKPGIANDVLERSVRHFRLTASGAPKDLPEWRYEQAIDDIIAHIHNNDISLPWSANDTTPSELEQVAAPLAWMTRDRRIAVGKLLVDMCDAAARDEQVHYIPYFQRGRGVAFVFLVSGEAREQRAHYLTYLVQAAQVEFNANIILGIATDPLGKGRSYDLLLHKGPVPREAKEFFQRNGSPFNSNYRQLLP
jgi:hypothetical protein